MKRGLRRGIHAASGSLVLLFLLPRGLFLACFWGLAAAALLVDASRLKWAGFSQRLRAALPVFRHHEAKVLSGATWLLLAYAIVSLLPLDAARAAVGVAAFADPVASLVGERFGPGTTKSLAGSSAFFGVAVAVVFLAGFSLAAAMSAGVLGTLVERATKRPLDDNLLVAPAVGLVLVALA